MSSDLYSRRRDAAAFVIAWLAQSPTTARLSAAAKSCNWQIEEVDDIIRWIIQQPACTAEIVLHLLDRFGVTSADEEGLRVEEASFNLCDQMVQGLREGRFPWKAAVRRDGRDTSDVIPVQAWQDVDVLNYCDLYENLGPLEEIPEAVKDAFELLGVGFGERVATVARQMLIDKGYGTDDE